MPRVSVVMPLYNAAAFVGDAVVSVLGQTMPDLELVVVNDGSTDGSDNIVSRIGDSRVRLVHQQNCGQSAAINRGVRESQGEFIKIVDADDWINAEHLQAQLMSIRGAPNCVSACRWGYFTRNFEKPQVRNECADIDYDDPLEWVVDSLTRDEGMMGGWKWLIPRRVWDRSGGYDEQLSLNNDFHASIAILLASSGVRIAPQAVYSYRKGLSAALSGTRSRKAMLSALQTTQRGCRLLLHREDSARIRRICANRYQRWAFEFFPQHPDLAAEAERAAADLGGASVEFAAGWVGRIVSRVFGWRNARRLQSLAVRGGWGQIQRVKRWWRTRRLA